MKEVQDTVFNYPKLKHWIEGRKNPKKEEKKVLKNLQELATEVSDTYTKSVMALLDTLLPLLYNNLYFHENGLDLKNIMKNNCVVFVPNHQSHADYITLNYLIYKKYGVSVHTAGGINLNIILLGKMLRKLGCFFIRRSLANNVFYKLTLEAYLYYLLKNQKPVEFFFEGGRSRTGRRLSPKFGFYQMLSNVYLELDLKIAKPLLFIPVSISHEYIPDQKSFAKELSGGKKQPESLSQFLGLIKLFAYQFGSLHIALGKPVEFKRESKENAHERTKKLALECFEKVEKGIIVTPSSLLSLVLIDGMMDHIKWVDILALSCKILECCKNLMIPYSKNLEEKTLKKSLEKAMDIMVGNSVIEVLAERHRKNDIVYSIKNKHRGDLVYLKNSITHHFLIPWLIAVGLEDLTKGHIDTPDALEAFFLENFERLEKDFSLPPKDQRFKALLKTASRCLQRNVENFHEMFHLPNEDIRHIAAKVNVLARLCRFMNEGYYLAAKGLNILGNISQKEFSYKTYTEKVKELFCREIDKRELVQFAEAYSLPLLKSCVYFFREKGLISYKKDALCVHNLKSLDKIVQSYEKRFKLI